MSDITFYEDSLYSERTMSKSEPYDYDRTKLKLDFNSASGISPAKRNNLLAGTPGNAGSLLQSPDLMMLKLGSPELENMIMQNNGFITTTPTPTDSTMPNQSTTTEEQEQFAAGFVMALQKLQQNGDVRSQVPRQPILVANSSGNYTRPIQKYSGLAYSTNQDVNGNAVSIKQEIIDSESSATVTASSSNYPVQSWANQARNKTSFVTKADLSRITNLTPYTSVPTSFLSQGLNQQTQRLRHPTTSSQLSAVRKPAETGLNKQQVSTSSNFFQTRNLQTAIPSAAYPVISSIGSVIKSSDSPRPQSFKIEDEAQIVPSNTPPLQSTPIDLKMQEVIKHERKKLRNRLAAQRCRKRKIEREEELKDKVKELKTENGELTNTRSDLRKQVIELKQKVMNHVNMGCHIFLPNSQTSVQESCSSPMS
eukprot:gene8160-9033_t